MSFILEKNSKGTLTTFTCIGNQAKTHLEKYKSKCFHNAKNLTYFENKSLVIRNIIVGLLNNIFLCKLYCDNIDFRLCGNINISS